MGKIGKVAGSGLEVGFGLLADSWGLFLSGDDRVVGSGSVVFLVAGTVEEIFFEALGE